MKTHRIRLLFSIFSPLLFLFLAVSCTKSVSVDRSGTGTQNITDNALFLTKNSESDELPVYGCVQLRRGDRIELVGTVSTTGEGTQRHTILTTSAGRVFILVQGKSAIPPAGTYRVKSTIQFEGNDQRIPELAVLSFEHIIKP